MEKAKLFFECERCGQPFDIEINAEDFKCVTPDDKRMERRECIFEFKRKSYCCGNEIEIKIYIWGDSTGTYKRHEISHKGLRNLRTGDNIESLINHICGMI